MIMGVLDNFLIVSLRISCSTELLHISVALLAGPETGSCAAGAYAKGRPGAGQAAIQPRCRGWHAGRHDCSLSASEGAPGAAEHPCRYDLTSLPVCHCETPNPTWMSAHRSLEPCHGQAAILCRSNYHVTTLALSIRLRGDHHQPQLGS